MTFHLTFPCNALMISSRRLLLHVSLLAFGLAGAAAPAAAKAQTSDRYASVRTSVLRQPVIYFVAKGSSDACGQGCSEWIAAEGMIDPEAGQRLRDFLGALSRRDLPIFFNSTGGFLAQGITLGSILREHRMTVGVGRTLPEGCRQAAVSDDACRRVMQSKREHKARLVTGGARCLSACVYAFVGGSVRQVARDAQLGIHASRLPAGGSLQATSVALLKRYIIEMGGDPGLMAAAAKVSADRISYLTRDQIVQFRIETRGFYETPWLLSDERADRSLLVKSLTQVERASSTEYRTSVVHVGCSAGGWVQFSYRRELSSNEIDAVPVIRVTAGQREFAAQGRRTEGAIELRHASGLLFVKDVIAAPAIVITETLALPGDAQGSSRVVKFSTTGLPELLGQPQNHCTGHETIDRPTASGNANDRSKK